VNGDNRSLLHAIQGPVMLIAVGLLFAADQFTGYSIWRTWPALLILFGVLKLLARLDGNSGGQMPSGGDL
jgi:hypothetical protein